MDPKRRIGGGIGRGLTSQIKSNSSRSSPMDSPGVIEEEKSINEPQGDPILKMSKVEITEEAEQLETNEDDDDLDTFHRRSNTVACLGDVAVGSGRKFKSSRAKIAVDDLEKPKDDLLAFSDGGGRSDFLAMP